MKSCKECPFCAVFSTECGDVRKCMNYKILISENNVEERKPSFCNVESKKPLISFK